jgi:hypothetical protein
MAVTYDLKLVESIRREAPELKEYSDEDILYAWEEWVVSTDFPNYKAIIRWLPKVKS